MQQNVDLSKVAIVYNCRLRVWKRLNTICSYLALHDWHADASTVLVYVAVAVAPNASMRPPLGCTVQPVLQMLLYSAHTCP